MCYVAATVAITDSKNQTYSLQNICAQNFLHFMNTIVTNKIFCGNQYKTVHYKCLLPFIEKLGNYK